MQFVEAKEFNGVLHMLWEVHGMEKIRMLLLCINPSIVG